MLLSVSNVFPSAQPGYEHEHGIYALACFRFQRLERRRTTNKEVTIAASASRSNTASATAARYGDGYPDPFSAAVMYPLQDRPVINGRGHLSKKRLLFYYWEKNPTDKNPN